MFSTTFTGIDYPSCFLRVGSTLVYPVSTSKGSPKGAGNEFQRCTYPTMNKVGTPTYFWCSKLY